MRGGAVILKTAMNQTAVNPCKARVHSPVSHPIHQIHETYLCSPRRAWHGVRAGHGRGQTQHPVYRHRRPERLDRPSWHASSREDAASRQARRARHHVSQRALQRAAVQSLAHQPDVRPASVIDGRLRPGAGTAPGAGAEGPRRAAAALRRPRVSHRRDGENLSPRHDRGR